MRTLLTAALLASQAALAGPAQKQEELEQRIRVLERKLELQSEDARARSRDGVMASAGDKGFGWKNADGSFEFRFKGLLQADSRVFVGDPAAQGLNDTFLLRRVEPAFELTLGKLAFLKIQPQFAGDSATTSDVYGELRFHPAFGLRAGKFKAPGSLEYLQASGALAFVERGFPTELSGGRDLGVQVQGELFGSTTSYAVAYGNGTPDGRDAASQDSDNRKEAGARLFFEPFRNDPGFLQGLGFGIAGTQGSKLGSAAAFNNTLPRYRSPGQNTIFQYLGTAVAAGRHARVAPQLYFYRGSFGLLGEQVVSRQDVAVGGVVRELEHAAYQGVASFVLTGEDAGYKGVKPSAPWQTGGPGWGALEVATRYGVLDTDDAAFPAYADPAVAVSEARNAGVALNWHLTGNARIGLDYEETDFTGGAAGGDRDREQVAFTRFQYSF